MYMRDWCAATGLFVQVVVCETDEGLNEEEYNNNCSEYCVSAADTLV
jgi:hypothetical protein